eukprot:10945136-Alexandrium_andersonii.AAC.1
MGNLLARGRRFWPSSSGVPGFLATMAGEADGVEQPGSSGPGRRGCGRDGPYGPVSAPAPAVQAGDPPPLPAR